MVAYMYQADLYCENCGLEIIASLKGAGKLPQGYPDETAYDSDEAPKGPFSDGGGEADCPQHCAACDTFLENNLTTHGYDYLHELLIERLADRSREPIEMVLEYAEYYQVDVADLVKHKRNMECK